MRYINSLLLTFTYLIVNEFHAIKACSYCQLVSSGRRQCWAASAMKCNTYVQSYSSEWTLYSH